MKDNKLTNHQLQVIEKLCERVNRHDFRIDSDDCTVEELRVLEALETNVPYGGWWNDDDTVNVVVEFDCDHNQYEVYCGNGWI